MDGGRQIAVLGGGVAGLFAARELERRHPGLEVVVFEARARLGGLVETERTPAGLIIEHGAEAFHPVGAVQHVAEGVGLDLGRLPTSSAHGVVAMPDGLIALAEPESGVWLRQDLGRARAVDAGSAAEALGPVLRTGGRRRPAAGMDSLVMRLASGLRGTVHTNVKVRSLSRLGTGFELRMFGGASARVEGVVLALPARESARLLEPVDHGLSALLGALPHADVQLVSFAFPRAALPAAGPPEAFALPPDRPGSLRACTWSTQGAHDATLVLRCFMHMPGASEYELRQESWLELREALGLGGTPHYWHVRTQREALPRGSEALAHAIATASSRHPNLRLAGSALGLVGVSAAAESGVDAARALQVA